MKTMQTDKKDSLETIITRNCLAFSRLPNLDLVVEKLVVMYIVKVWKDSSSFQLEIITTAGVIFINKMIY